jgi:hypothetical protein
MTFPLRYEVEWYHFDGGATNELGNEIESWLPPVTRKVIGWVPGTTVERGEYDNREVVDALLLVPPDFDYNKRDRVDLHDPDGILYFIVGGDDYSHTSPFTAWKPGSTIKLRAVKG